MNKHRALLIATPFFIFIITVFSLNSFVFPKVTPWLNQKINTFIKTKSPVELKFESFTIDYFPPAINIAQISIRNADQYVETLQPITIQSVAARLDLIHALAGHLNLSAIVIDGLNLEMDLDALLNRPGDAQELPIKELFQVLNKIPVDKLEIESPSITLHWRKKNTDLKIAGSYLRSSLENENQLRIETKLMSEITVLENTYNLDFQTSLRLDQKNLTVQSLSLNSNGLSVEGKGLFPAFSKIAIEPQADIFLKSKIDLNKNHFLIKNFFFQNLNSLSGLVDLQIQGLISSLQQTTFDFEFKFENFDFNAYSIGSGETSGSIKNQELKINQFFLKNSAGLLELKKAALNLLPPYSFKTSLEIKTIYAQKLLQNLNFKNIPIELIASGQAQCTGQIKSFNLNCPVNIETKDVKVGTSVKSEKSLEIIAIPSLYANGNIYFDENDFKFSSHLAFSPLQQNIDDNQLLQQKNSGFIDGIVNYKTGYTLNFKTSYLDFKNIKNLANLDLEGSIQLIGSSKGNSNQAEFQALTSVENFYIKNYFLDKLSSNISYKSSLLNFENINGNLKQSQFMGGLNLNFNDSSLSGAIHFEKAHAEDLTAVFSRLVTLPAKISGLGPVHLKFNGPLDFWKLNFKLVSSFVSGKFHSDSFDRLQLNLHKENETIHFDDVYLVKNKSRLTAQGNIIGPTPNWNLQFESLNLKLEESEIVSAINSSISGLLNAKAKLVGTLQAPELSLRATLTETFIDEQALPSSTLDFELNDNRIEGVTNIFGNRIQSEFTIPISNQNSIHSAGSKPNVPLKIRAQTSQWSFNDFLVLFGGVHLKNQYTTNLTASVNLESKTGKLSDLNGDVTIDQFLLQRAQQFLKNPEKISMDIKNGVAQLSNFNLIGNENSIRLQSDRFTLDQFNMEFDVQCSLALLHIFIPVLEDLNGKIILKTTTSGPLTKPKIIGQANISEGFIKIPNFPHPIEKLQGEVSFSQSKIILSKIKGILGGGTIQSGGQIKIDGLKNLPMDLNIKIDQANLNVPDRFKTRGDLNLKLTGSWFPFLISGQYLISEAFIDKEFSGGSNNVNLKQSIYLPKTIREQVIDPIILDLQILIQNNALIKNSHIDGGVLGSLNIKGSPGAPQIIGEITFTKDSKLFFKETPFNIQTGVVKFTDPTEINPDFYITGNSRVGEYDVNLLIQGNAKNINIQPSSIPPLSKQDLFTLLALGTTASNLDQANSVGGVERRQTELALGSAILSQTGIDKKVKENTGFDVQVGSFFDTSKNVSIPRVTVSKNLRKKLNASYSRTLGDQTQSEARLQYLINNNLSAIGSWQSQEAQEGSTTRFNGLEKEILGIDLEFKREFK